MDSSCTRFTAAEGGARLAACAGTKNILVTEHTSFISTSVLMEHAYKIRGLMSTGCKRSVYITRASRIECTAHELSILTDLSVSKALVFDDVDDWNDTLEHKEVLVCTSIVIKTILENGLLTIPGINVLIIDSCHLIFKDQNLQYVMKLYKECNEDIRPRILALTYPLFTAPGNTSDGTDTVNIDKTEIDKDTEVDDKDRNVESDDDLEIANDNVDDFDMYEKLEWKICELETALCCETDLAEDIDGGKRLSATATRPRELIVEYGPRDSMEALPEAYLELEDYMKETVNHALQFINEHRYDPTEIYGEDMYEEFKNIPDPTIEPKNIFVDFLYVLEQLGPYAADKAAISLLTKLEKLKIKVPYERHFLLLCLCTSVFVKIRCFADLMFSKCASDWEKITMFSTPKVLRLVEILEKFQPTDNQNVSKTTIGSSKANTNRNTEGNVKLKEETSDSSDTDSKLQTDSKTDENNTKSDGTVPKDEASDVKISKTRELLNEIDKCDFVTLGNRIEDRVNTYEANLKDYEYTEQVSVDKVKYNEKQSVKCDDRNPVDGKIYFGKRFGHRSRGRGRALRSNAAKLLQMQQNPDALCGIVFMKEALMAKIMFMMIADMSRSRPSLSHLCAQYCAEEGPNGSKKQEDVLKKFRMHECNLLLATSVLEEGIDLPRCNLVVRWDVPPSYRSHGLCRGRARASRSAVALLAARAGSAALAHNLAVYKELDQLITRKCGCGIQNEPSIDEDYHADTISTVIKAYTPLELKRDKNNVPSDRKIEDQAAFVDLNTAIALINRYCGKLPSDTFTRLTPQWWMEEVQLPDRRGDVKTAYICTLRMPLNCPIKYNIVGHPMPTRVLARRMVALQACRILHKSGELDDQLMPIGKENFKSAEFDNNVVNETSDANDCARPGTTKRRQYYYKRTAWAFTDCQAIIDCTDLDIENNPTLDANTIQNMKKGGPSANMLYCIVSSLCCALPERYNTRGRRLHAPQLARQAIGVLMARRDPHQLQIPAFPVYTRSGEVRVSVEAALEADVRLSPRRARLIRRFMRFVFSDVLRVRRRGMKLQPEGSTHNNYYVVPTVKKTRSDGTTWVDIDWPFLELIYKHTEEKKNSELEKPMIWEEGEKKKTKDDKVKNLDNPLLKPGEVFVFDAERYKEAVVTPWYRNQDQPQFFLVAEICWKLTPDSAFPSDQHTSFRSYYKAKYGAELTQSCQPLLDVDHTSARLNLLTPRYVNRKGVALPVSSERTRRAKRDRLDQKQILVPELCRVHPFAAPLWFATVALPCVLYRINALLIADEIRRSVAIDVGLGIPRIDERTCPGFQWPPLDFGWSLAEVLSADSEKGEKKKEDEEAKIDDEDKDLKTIEDTEPEKETDDQVEEKEGVKEKTINDILQEKEDAESCFEIGTWSNDMASSIPQRSEFDEFMEPLPPNLTFCTSSSGGANWSDPIEKPKISHYNPSRTFSMADSDCSYLSSDFDTDDSDLTDGSDEDTDTSGFCSSRNSNALLSAAMGVRIEYKTAHEAEAVDLERRRPLAPAPPPDRRDDRRDLARARRALRAGAAPPQYVKKFRESVAKHEQEIKDNGLLIDKGQKIRELLPETSRDIDKNSTLAHTDKQSSIDVDDENKSTKVKIDVLDRKNVRNNKLDNFDEIIEILNDIDLNETSNNIDIVTEDNSKVILDAHSVDADDAMILKAITNKSKDIDSVTKQMYSNLNITKDIGYDKNINSNAIENGNATDETKSETITILADDISNVETNSLNNDDIERRDDDELIDKIKDIKDETEIGKNNTDKISRKEILDEIFPYGDGIELDKGQVTLESIERNKRVLLANLKNRLSKDEIKKLNCFSMRDINIDSPDYVNEKIANVGFDSKEKYERIVNTWSDKNDYKPYYMDSKGQNGKEFDFDYQPNLEGHPGPSPSVILQALTMSNANDGINLERLETIGDSFLKFAITAYLYCAHPAVHEGKLSHMRSKQVSNLNLYRLGRNKRLGARMIASKFEPHDNWLPPCHKPPPTLQPTITGDSKACHVEAPVDSTGCFIPYNLITQHSIPDKSIADCVEALIGAYLLECGPRGALLFMSWLGIRVLPRHDLPLADDHPYVVRAREKEVDDKSSPKRRSSCSSWSDDEDSPESRSPEPEWGWGGRPVGALRPYRTADNKWLQPIFGELKAPPSPLLRYIEDPEGELEQMLSGYDALERTLQYRFRDRSLLLQALTHASHQRNRLTDCYQRLEFLGDAILDYLITRHLFEDPRRHSPGALTDLRSALVNNTIFATLAARHGFHKYFRHMSPGLNEVLTKYVKIQEENGHSISEEHYLIQEDEMEQAEDVEVPKALGDLFESVAGAIFLDSGLSLSAVWRSAGALLGAELDAFSAAAPKSPVRELLEAEPDTAKFGKPERLADGRRVRVCVEVFGRGAFKGIGRNYRIAKGTAARCALRHLRNHRPR
ncbi:endoribonuclease Dcr-1-like [Vanessa tameamea]|uniref:Endoribonuclease Dcr-1-like n=1 Tax=Vanessa tameamea TaxID=334116 RepID=A0ABM4AXW5_VANTA